MGSRRPCGSTGASIRVIVSMPRTVVWLLIVSGIIAGFSCRPYAQTPKPDDHGRISIVDYGAVPDGRTDSTTAITAAVRAAKAQRRSVFVPPGTFIHGSFSLDSVGMSGAGATSILVAPDPKNSNIYLRGHRSSLQNLTLKVHSSGRDHSNFVIYVDRARDFLIEAVEVDGGNAGGIYNFGGSDGRIIRNQIQNTLADAIHNTDGAHGIIIADNTVRHAGDDMIAVVSYSNERIVHNILIENNDLMDSASSRGISVVGGEDVTIQGNTVARTSCCAGIYLASEAFWKTHAVRNVVVRNNLLSDNSGSTWHGAIMMFADQRSVHDIRVEHNIIINARHAAVRLLGNVANVTLIDNSLIRPADEGIAGGGTTTYCVGNTLNHVPTGETACGGSIHSEATASGATLRY
jgi:hypothetical protein